MFGSGHTGVDVGTPLVHWLDCINATYRPGYADAAEKIAPMLWLLEGQALAMGWHRYSAWLPTVMIGRLLICSWLRVLQVYSALQVKLELL